VKAEKQTRTPRARLKYRAAVWVLQVCAVLPLAGETFAREADSGIDEIIVTARKRDEALGAVPLSVTAYSADQLAGLRATVSPDIAQHTPNLMWHSILGFATPNIFLRGIGNTTFNSNQAGPVGIHIDGVYQGSSASYGFGLLDLARVEILKGPQGTLFGRNTTGGVINFISARPDPGAGFNARAIATYGRFNQAELDGAVGFDVGGSAAARVAGQMLNRDGHVTNRTPGSGIDKQGKVDAWSGRAQFAYEAGALDVLLNIHGGKNHSDVAPGKQIGVLCAPGVPVPRLGQCSDFFGFTDTTNFRESFTNIPSFDAVDTWGGGATLTWTSDAFTLLSQTQADANSRKLVNDSDAGPFPSLKTNVKSHYHQFTQELRATSTTEGPLSWIAGANYYSDDLSAFQNFTLNGFGPGALSRFFPVEEGIASILDQTTRSYAFFGEANYSVLPRLTVTGGVRWTHDRRAADTQAYIFNATGFSRAFADRPTTEARLLVPTIPATQVARSWSKWSGRGIISYEMADDVMVYGGIAHGFKGGDFNGGALFAPSEANISNPEFVTSYEAGVRGSTGDKRLSFDVAGFYYDFTDQQVSVVVPGSNATLQTLSNAGKTRVKGIEAELSALPIDSLFLQIKTGVLDANFVRFQLDPSNPATNYAGNRTASSPKFSLAGMARHRAVVGYGVWSVQTDFSYTGAHFFSADNNPSLRQEGYWLLNGNLKFETSDERYSVMAWAKNIADEKYYASGLSNASFGFMEVFPGLPRTFGVTVAGKF